MTQITERELVQLGREAVDYVAGPGTVQDVEVAAGADSSDLPAYYFSILVDPGRYGQRPIPVHARIMQKLIDELAARGDAHFPYLRVFDRADWDRRSGG